MTLRGKSWGNTRFLWGGFSLHSKVKKSAIYTGTETMHRASGHAKLFGRVAALAVAFGVGVAVATSPGLAWADDDSAPAQPSSPDVTDPGQDATNSSVPDSAGPADTGVASQEPAASAPETGTAATVAVGDSPEVTYGVSGGAQISGVGTADQDAAADVTQPAPAAPVATLTPAPAAAVPPAAAPFSIPTVFGPLHIGLSQDSGAASRGRARRRSHHSDPRCRAVPQYRSPTGRRATSAPPWSR